MLVAVFFYVGRTISPSTQLGVDLARHGVLLYLLYRHQGRDRIKVLKFRTPRWIRFATTHISHGLGVSSAAFTQGPRDLPKDAMDLLYLSRAETGSESVLQRVQVEVSSKVLIHGNRVLQLLMHARPRIPCTLTDACESPCHKPRLRGLDRNLATSASANLRRVLIHTHVLSMHMHCTTDDSLRERGPYSHTIRAGSVSPVCLTFPTLWSSVVSRLKVSPCQVHHVHTPKGADPSCFSGSNRRSPEALRPCFTWSDRLRVTRSKLTLCCDAAFFDRLIFWHSRTACPERQLGLERDGSVGVGLPFEGWGKPIGRLPEQH